MRLVGVPVGTAVVALSLWLAVAPSLTGQQSPSSPFPAYRPARMADGHPDLNGIWQALVTANIDVQDHEARPGPHTELVGAYGGEPPGQSVVEGGEIPYQPWALAKKKENFDKRATVDVSSDKTWHALGDPELKCYMPGVPRATYMPFPFQIVQGSSPYILMAYQFTSATRTIRMNWKGEARPMRGWAGRAGGGRATRSSWT